MGHHRLGLEETHDRQHIAGADTSDLAVVGFKLRLAGQPDPTTARDQREDQYLLSFAANGRSLLFSQIPH